ncbi:MAG: TolC family protein [Clostridiales bacterium]|nr:TolC family protein [Clostridiales bacterium]
MLKTKCFLFSASAVLLTGLCPVTAFAQQSPEFAYTAEKWATLRDDNLEYDEIADLIHEYNNTVVQNAITYRNDYLDKDADDVAQDYYDAAEDIYSNLTYPDSDDANYGSGVSSYLNSQIQAENLVEQGDKNTDNAKTMRLTYDQTEANLVKQAQEQMISYYSQLYSLESLEENVNTARTSLASEEIKLSAGTSTESKVLSARQTLSQAEANYQSAQSSLNTAKENLLLMLGWSYGSDVAIGELPEPDIEAIEAIDLESDIAAAIANNYALQITNYQLENARSSSVVETLTQTKSNSSQAISNSVSSAYSSLLLAVSNYEQAKETYDIQQAAVDTAERQMQAGTITQNSYASTEAAYHQAEVTVRTTKLALLTALVDYQWEVNGLASTS